MDDEHDERETLTEAELDEQDGEELPNREAMSVIDPSGEIIFDTPGGPPDETW